MTRTITIISSNPLDDPWGLARQAALLANGLSHEGVRVNTLAPPSRSLFWRYLYLFFSSIPSADIYLIASHVVSHFRLRLPSDRTVIWVADLIPLRWGPTYARVFLKTEMLFMREIALMGNSEYTFRRLKEYFSKVIGFVYPPISPEFYPRSNSEIESVRERYHLPESFMLHVGNTKPHKNVGALFKAARIVKMPVVKVGGDKTEIYSLAKKYGVRTVYIPYVETDRDLASIYSAATVYVQPSLEEGFGYPVVEAAACGTPVVVSNHGPLPEIAKLIEGHIVPSTPQAIANAVKQVDGRIPSRIARKVRKLFSPESSARQFLRILKFNRSLSCFP